MISVKLRIFTQRKHRKQKGTWNDNTYVNQSVSSHNQRLALHQWFHLWGRRNQQGTKSASHHQDQCWNNQKKLGKLGLSHCQHHPHWKHSLAASTVPLFPLAPDCLIAIRLSLCCLMLHCSHPWHERLVQKKWLWNLWNIIKLQINTNNLKSRQRAFHNHKRNTPKCRSESVASLVGLLLPCNINLSDMCSLKAVSYALI